MKKKETRTQLNHRWQGYPVKSFRSLARTAREWGGREKSRMISGGGCSKQGASAPKRQSQRATRPNSGKTMDPKRSCNIVQRARLGCLGESQKALTDVLTRRCHRNGLPVYKPSHRSIGNGSRPYWTEGPSRQHTPRQAIAIVGGEELSSSACRLANPPESAAPAGQVLPIAEDLRHRSALVHQIPMHRRKCKWPHPRRCTKMRGGGLGSVFWVGKFDGVALISRS
ncbi:hypothetical protein B0T20DRAFT_166613 [Sordaria brevicollis]|uniref:Uncharacterized protein n=1 Tax=Sordaria brevicollis TaxID=83679 RepID=A0AAE0PHJ9_SORBR|nr:hypothetical protein B0T20DRAFT_166613 [Sordaria brevicollis]